MEDKKNRDSGKTEADLQDSDMIDVEINFPEMIEGLKNVIESSDASDAEKKRNRELYNYVRNKYDNTGALKRKFFGLEMQALLSRKEMLAELEGMERDIVGGMEPRPIPRLEFSEDGTITVPEGENKSFVFVNMGELDRFNKEGGGHEAGDAGLRQTERIFARTVYGVLREAGVENPADKCEIYRFDGNTFVADIHEIPGDDDRPEGERIRDIVAARVSGSGTTVPGVEEPAPLVTASMDLKEAVGLFHSLQAELEPGKRVTDPDRAARELFGVLAGYADHAMDVNKFESRVNRILDKLDEADGDVEKVRPFFENYMKKMFTDTGLESIEDFASFDRSRLPDMALEYARRNLGKATDFREVETDAIRRELSRVRAEDVVSARARELSRPELTERGEAGQYDIVLAEIPDRTRGQRLLDEKLDAYRETAPPEDGDREARLVKETAALEYMIEFARRDQGTGLLERGIHYEDLEKDIEEEKDVSMLFVDMGFLKYFDKAGGRDVGNDALKLAAELMERAVDVSGVDATVYRYAGDEFTVRISGGREDADAFREALERLKHDDEGRKLAVPQGKAGAENGYFPTGLVFNDGFADREMAENVFADLREAGVISDQENGNHRFVHNKKAELMTMLADKGITDKKAIGRFGLLIGRMRDSRYAEVGDKLAELAESREREIQERLAAGEALTPEEMRVRPERLLAEVEADREAKDFWLQTEQMTTYSNKAIFAEDGGVNLLRAWAESGRDMAELRDEIETFVEQCVEEAENKDKDTRELRDRLIETNFRADYFEKKVGEYQARLEEAGGENRALRDEIEVLRGMLESAKEEKRQLTERRRQVDAAD